MIIYRNYKVTENQPQRTPFFLAKKNTPQLHNILGGSSHDGRKWLITIVSKSPIPGVMGPLPNGLFMAYNWG